MQLTWLAIAVVATVGYHLVLKLTPAAANPFLSLAVTYAIVTALFAALYAAMPGTTTLRGALPQLNWTAVALAAHAPLCNAAMRERCGTPSSQ